MEILQGSHRVLEHLGRCHDIESRCVGIDIRRTDVRHPEAIEERQSPALLEPDRIQKSPGTKVVDEPA